MSDPWLGPSCSFLSLIIFLTIDTNVKPKKRHVTCMKMVRMMQIMSDECAMAIFLEVFVQVLRSPEVKSHVAAIYNLVLT